MGWKTSAALLTLSVLGLGSLVYFLMRKDEENEDMLSYKSSKSTVIEMKVPKESVGIVIGRGGNTLREIESKSDTTINIRDDDDISGDFQICVIRGTPECAQYAECLIHEIIVNQPLIETCEMYIPTSASGRIIGKGGDNIRMISRSSNARITLANSPVPMDFERKVIIKGTAEQIALAKILIEQRLEEEKDFRNKLETQVSNRSPRNKPKYLLPAKAEQEEVEAHRYKEKFVAASSYGLLEVYVSAIESPDRMWVQMMGPCTVALDLLNEQMTDYYAKEENRELHKLKQVKCGQIVAAPFTYDEKWYRAEVLDVQINSEVEEPEVLLYYVDYGDTCLCKKGNVYGLRTDFLRLRFQAIECMLAKVKPRDSTWSEEAIELLGDLTHVAMWKSLVAKVHSYKDRPTRAKREGSPVPCVELYDTHGEKTVNVAEELVEKGFAVWTEGAESSGLEKSSNGIYSWTSR